MDEFITHSTTHHIGGLLVRHDEQNVGPLRLSCVDRHRRKQAKRECNSECSHDDFLLYPCFVLTRYRSGLGYRLGGVAFRKNVFILAGLEV